MADTCGTHDNFVQIGSNFTCQKRKIVGAEGPLDADRSGPMSCLFRNFKIRTKKVDGETPPTSERRRSFNGSSSRPLLFFGYLLFLRTSNLDNILGVN